MTAPAASASAPPAGGSTGTTPTQGQQYLRGLGTRLWLFFLGTLVAHILFVSLTPPGSSLGATLAFFLPTIGIFAALWFWAFRHEADLVRGGLIAAFGALIVYLLPQIVTLGTSNLLQNLQNLTAFLYYAVPILPLYIMLLLEHASNSKIFHFFAATYKITIFLLGVVFAIALLVNSSGTLLKFQGSGVTAASFGNFWDFLFKDTAERLGDIGAGTRAYYAQATDPNAYYAGNIEENSKVPLGVEITQLRMIEERVSNTSPIIVYGTVKTRPFQTESFGTSSAQIIPSCSVEAREPVVGVASPPLMDVVWGTSGTFQCTLQPIAKPGSYEITGAATFPFETWAYIPYTFVDERRARNIALQGLDVTQELGIEESPIAIYTSGPVSLGLGGTPQPILVDFTKEQPIMQGTRFGVTLDSNWRNGRSKINSVNWIKLKVPYPFSLEKCDRTPDNPSGEADENDPLYHSYTFTNPKIDPLIGFTSVTCELTASQGGEAGKSLAEWLSVDTATLSFVGAAQYTYTLEEQTRVIVR